MMAHSVLARTMTLTLIAITGLCIAAPDVHAETIGVSDYGWFRDDGHHSATWTNTFTGRNADGTIYYRSFMLFDLSAFAGSATSATLSLELVGVVGPDADQTFDVFSYEGSLGALSTTHAQGATSGINVFADLGTGSTYGSSTVDSSDAGSTIQVTLSSTAVSAINAAAGGLFAVGLRNRSPDDYPSYSLEGISFSSGSEASLRSHALVIGTGQPVPEPGTLALLGVGLAACAVHLRRRSPNGYPAP